MTRARDYVYFTLGCAAIIWPVLWAVWRQI